jgi:hypothetical protein
MYIIHHDYAYTQLCVWKRVLKETCTMFFAKFKEVRLSFAHGNSAEKDVCVCVCVRVCVCVCVELSSDEEAKMQRRKRRKRERKDTSISMVILPELILRRGVLPGVMDWAEGAEVVQSDALVEPRNFTEDLREFLNWRGESMPCLGFWRYLPTRSWPA